MSAKCQDQADAETDTAYSMSSSVPPGRTCPISVPPCLAAVVFAFAAEVVFQFRHNLIAADMHQAFALHVLGRLYIACNACLRALTLPRDQLCRNSI